MLVMDKWTSNVNGRQAVFGKRPRERRYTATFIDQGYCFNAGEWKLIDTPLRGVFASNLVYERVVGWESFEPWLGRVEADGPADDMVGGGDRFRRSGTAGIRQSWSGWWRR